MASTVCTAAFALSGVPSRGRAFLATGMQPDVAAKTLAKVEDEWKAQAWLFVECSNTSAADADPLINCPGAPKAFERSCDIVVQALLHGSKGDRDVTREYLNDVCGQSVLANGHQEQCQEIAAAITDIMGENSYENRNSLKPNSVCTGFWSKLLDGATQRFAQQQAERLEQEKKAAAEAAAQKAAEEARIQAEIKAKQEAEAKAKAEEEAKAKAEAEAKAKADAEAKAKAEAEAKAEAAKFAEETKHTQMDKASATTEKATGKSGKNNSKGTFTKNETPNKKK